MCLHNKLWIQCHYFSYTEKNINYTEFCVDDVIKSGIFPLYAFSCYYKKYFEWLSVSRKLGILFIGNPNVSTQVFYVLTQKLKKNSWSNDCAGIVANLFNDQLPDSRASYAYDDVVVRTMCETGYVTNKQRIFHN